MAGMQTKGASGGGGGARGVKARPVATIFDPSTITDGRMIITPAIAKEMLRYNSANRPLHEYKVAQYTRDMENGNWVFNGDPIRFSSDRVLLDGQHRLAACIRSKTAFDTNVVGHLPTSVMGTIDRGKSRTVGDLFGIRGEESPLSLASAARWLWRILQGPTFIWSAGYVPTQAELDSVLIKYPELRRSVAFTTTGDAKAFLVPTMGRGRPAAVHCIIQRNYPQAADDFFTALMTGENLNKKSPVKVLRDRVTRTALPKAHRPDWEIVYLLVRAWNAFIEGREVGKLVIASKRLPFPLIVGGPDWPEAEVKELDEE